VRSIIWKSVVFLSYAVFLPRKAVNSSVMRSYICAKPWLPNMQDHDLLTLSWWSFSWCANAYIMYNFWWKGCWDIYINYNHKETPRLSNMQDTNRRRSNNAHFRNGAGSLSRLFLLLMAKYMSLMDVCDQSSVRLPKMWEQKSFTLCWRSLSG